MSTVIGTVLLATIAALLAAVVGTPSMAMEQSLAEPAPTASFGAAFDPSGAGNDGVAYLDLTFEAGETLDGDGVSVLDDDGDREHRVDIWRGGPEVSSGQYVHVDGEGSDCELDAVREWPLERVVRIGNDGSQVTIAEREVAWAPNAAAGRFSG